MIEYARSNARTTARWVWGHVPPGTFLVLRSETASGVFWDTFAGQSSRTNLCLIDRYRKFATTTKVLL